MLASPEFWQFAAGVLGLISTVLTYFTIRAKLAANAVKQQNDSLQTERDALRAESVKVFERLERIADRTDEREQELAVLYAKIAVELKECQIQAAKKDARIEDLNRQVDDLTNRLKGKTS